MGRVIGMTFDVKDDWVRGPDDPADVNAEFDSAKTLDRIIEAVESGGHTVKRIGNVHKLLEQIDVLDVDIVFNLCEGRYGRNRESQVPMLLELKNIPYIGSDALTLGITLDKVVAKKIFQAEGIPTAPYFTASSLNNLTGKNTIGYPLIVKTSHEGSSKGISSSSRVTDEAGLRRQVDLINKQYKQPALVEKFISGMEFTVAVLGNDNPKAMPVVQVSLNGSVALGNEFYTFDRISSKVLTYICPAKVSSALTARLQELAVKAYIGVGCRDFGRVDFRVDEEGNPFCLEVNPLPTLSCRDVFNLFPQLMGSDFNGAVNYIIDIALERHGMLNRAELKQVSAPVS